jgi:hypothetical protein
MNLTTNSLPIMPNPIDCLSVKIVLLNLLNNLPEQPSINLSSQYITTQESQPSRTLEFKHEISITQQLSFICAYSNDPLHVLATCVEEGFPRSCLIIRLAANTGRHEALVDGLKAISRILQNEAIDGLCPLLKRSSLVPTTYSEPLYEQ